MARRLGVVVFAIAADRDRRRGPRRDERCGGDRGQAAAKKPLEFEAHDLYIETNDTDKDAGLQLFADGEEWRHFKLLDTNGDTMINLNTKGKVRKVGLSELFLEASEPSFDEVPLSKFKKQFPEGKYRFRGETPSRPQDGRLRPAFAPDSGRAEPDLPGEGLDARPGWLRGDLGPA